jgi:hypothetical protein
MELNIEDFELPVYPSLRILLDERRADVLEIRSVFKFELKDGQRALENVYWVISCNHCLFTKNKTWVQEPRHKTDKFREKTAFDSIQEAIAFTKKHWDKIKL